LRLKTSEQNASGQNTEAVALFPYRWGKLK